MVPVANRHTKTVSLMGTQHDPMRQQVHFTGGCVRHAPRADYAKRLDCSPKASCMTCDGGGESCVTHHLPSGMHFPRHNTPQYTGNAVWDARSLLSIERAVAAILGDPFVFARSPYMDALRLVFSGLNSSQLLERFMETWPADERYTGNQWATSTRERLMRVIGRLNPDYVRRSKIFSKLPSWLQVQLRREHLRLSPEAADCAAALVMDLDFDARPSGDIWLRELISDEGGIVDVHREYEKSSSFWSEIYAGAEDDQDLQDPHNVIYSSIFQTHANGWYGGNLTFVFAQASGQGSSGIDRDWLERGCPGPVPVGADTADWYRRFCSLRTSWRSERARSNPDAGEIRSPNYKIAAEVDGVLTYSWKVADSHAILQRYHAANQDLSALCNSVEWAFFRHRPPPAGQQRSLASWRHSRMLVMVLAPAHLEGTVAGIHEQCCPQVFTSLGHAPVLEDDIDVPGFAFRTADRPSGTTSIVPVWGVLHRCKMSNLKPSTARRVSNLAEDRDALCAAYDALIPHTQGLSRGTLARLEALELPDHFISPLQWLRLWDPDAILDLAQSDQVDTSRPQDHICLLSLAHLNDVKTNGYC